MVIFHILAFQIMQLLLMPVLAPLIGEEVLLCLGLIVGFRNVWAHLIFTLLRVLCLKSPLYRIHDIFDLIRSPKTNFYLNLQLLIDSVARKIWLSYSKTLSSNFLSAYLCF